MSTFISY